MSSKLKIIKQCNVQLTQTTLQYLCVDGQDPLVNAIDKPIIVLLHGFPENSWTWEAYIEPLSAHFCVIAPDLPGYNGSAGFARESDYNIAHLVDTLASFVTTLTKGQAVHLVAHDWGGVIAWPLVAFHRELFIKLTILNAAHPTGFTREMANNPKQQANSDYISDLISDRAYAITSADDHKMLRRLYAKAYFDLSEQQRSAYQKQWENQHSMQQAFAYYKNMPQLVTKRVRANTEVKLPNIMIKLPTQVLWGLRDTAFVPEVLQGMQEWVEDLTLVEFDDADHWLHHQERDIVLRKLIAYHS
ncbi:alpha/beta fold hydrolase [Glaciecola siphonariae]|uniref:Alpha/beta fold hydrolase n=1 Tax=Glaciecola siphonariae TaxID=521012 RepID=A0ABV9LSW1_9ALTE